MNITLRSLFIAVCAVTVNIAVTAQTDSIAKSEPRPHIELDSLAIDLGSIPADTIVEAVMRFRNTGAAPLVIERVFAECGCTSPGFTRDSIPPHAEGEIKVKFNSKGRAPGTFRKALRVRSNADNRREVFYITGKIKRPYRQ